MLQLTREWKYLWYSVVISFGKWEVQLLIHVVVLFLTFLGSLHTVFHSGCTNLYSPWQHTRVLFSSQPCQHLFISCLLLLAAIFWGVWCDSSLWFWFAFPWSLVMLNTFSCTCWPSVYLIWKNVYLGSLHIFSLDCIFYYWLFSRFWMRVSIVIIWSLYCHCVSGSCMCQGWDSIRMADNFVFVFSFTSYQIKENHTQVISLRSITCTWTWYGW